MHEELVFLRSRKLRTKKEGSLHQETFLNRLLDGMNSWSLLKLVCLCERSMKSFVADIPKMSSNKVLMVCE